MDPLEKAIDRAVQLGSIERAYADGYAAAKAEINRLRAALETIACDCTTARNEAPTESERNAWNSTVQFARRALEQEAQSR